MNANEHFEEDDLLQYAMRLLPESQHDAMTEWIAANPDAQQRLAEVQAILGAFAEASVELRPAPKGSLERLLTRIDETSVPHTAPSVVAQTRPKSLAVVPAKRAPARHAFGLWAGWAVAAVLACSTGAVAFRLTETSRAIAARSAEVASLSADAAELRREREAMQAHLAEEQARAAHLSGAAQAAQGQAQAAQKGAATLESALAGKTEEARTQSARALEAEREQSRLQGTIAQQEGQLAEASAANQDAQILAALTDPSAFRVVLTKPKSKPAPTGRAAYVASKGILVFLVSHLPAPKPNKVYELWLLPASGANPVPAGTFVPDAEGNAHLTYAQFPQSVAAKGFAVTEENTGGAQVPTPPLLLAGS